MANAQLAFDILARDRASNTFDKISKKSQTMGDRIAGVGTRMAKSLGLVALGGVAALGAGFVKGVQDAASFEVVVAKTEAVIKSTGNTANISVGGVKSLAASLENLSGVDEELIINSQNVLATFTKVRNEVGAGNDIFDRGTEAALNMSVALGQDLQSATIMVGKALNDPIRGITALRRAGVQLTEQQEAQIRTMVESGDVLGAQKIILAELETQFGGVAAAAGDTFQGKVNRAKDAVADMGREVGEMVLPALGSFADWVASDGVPMLKDFAGVITDEVVPTAVEMGNIFSELPDPIKKGIVALGGITAAAPIAVAGWKKVKAGIDAVTVAYGAMGKAGKIATLSLGGIGLALSAGAIVLGFFARAKVEAKQRVESFTAAIEADSGALGENTAAAIASAIAKEGIADAAEKASVSIDTVAKAIAGDTAAMSQLEGRHRAVNAEIDSLLQRQFELSESEIRRVESLQAQSGALENVIGKVQTQRDAMGEARSEYELSQEVLAATNGALGENAAAAAGATTAAEDQVAALDDLIATLNEASGQVLNQRDAERQLEESYDNASAAIEENGVTLDVTTEAGRRNQAALDDIAESALQQAEAMLQNGASHENVQAKMENARAEFIRTATQMGMNEKQANKLADQLGLIPGNYKANVSAPGATRADAQVHGANAELRSFDGRYVTASVAVRGVQAVERQLQALTRTRFVPIVVTGGSSMAGGLTRAHGGRVDGPGTETSDSIPVRLSRNEHVLSAKEVRGLGGHDMVERMRAAARSGRRALQAQPRSAVMAGAPARQSTVTVEQTSPAAIRAALEGMRLDVDADGILRLVSSRALYRAMSAATNDSKWGGAR